MTEKLPVQSSRALISAASRSPASSGFGIGIRINTTPQVRGSTDPRANSPKSLSKVSKIRAQCIASIGETREDVVARNTWVILQNIGFAPSVGHQADHEFDGKSRATYDGFADEHVGRKRDARMIHDG